ncbi:MAG TPA: aminotransferase class I/II-fold pyridoxal phosphate-dependent enzyme [Legionella sp.]|nr:aminotransferase class I/II-fold pyridoxal phosphate-dependent enzyme [Legionella sp.]
MAVDQITYLNRNESQYDLSPRCKGIIDSLSPQMLTHYPQANPLYTPEVLLNKLSVFLDLPAHNLLLGNGSEDLLKTCIHKYLQRNEYLLTPECSWWYYDELVTEIKGHVCHFKTTEHDNYFSLDLDSFKEAYRQYNPTVVLLASPNNPTGHSIDAEVLEEILTLCKNSVVIVDEAYWGFNSTRSYSYKNLMERHPNVLFIRSFSKFFGLAGVRMGYAISSDYFYELKNYMKRYLGYSSFGVALCIAALEDIDYFDAINQLFIKDKLDFYELFNSTSPIKAFQSDTNFILLRHAPDLYEPIKKTFDDGGYLLSYLRSGLLKDCVRITLGRPEQNREVLKLMLSVLHNYQLDGI